MQTWVVLVSMDPFPSCKRKFKLGQNTAIFYMKVMYTFRSNGTNFVFLVSFCVSCLN